MEDLDHPKVKPHAAQNAMEDLRWLGLDWDYGPDTGGPDAPYVQSARAPYYRAALEKLRTQHLVYPCICSRRDVEEAQSAPHDNTEGLYYRGTCYGRFSSYRQAAAMLPPNRLPAWRFHTIPGETTGFTDGFHGRQQQQVHDAVGDFVIARHPDGAGYMLAVVEDDAAMGVTEVLRGDDLLDTTHRQLLLYSALGYEPPHFIHVPLVVAPDGRRLAKRHGDTRIRMLRDRGVSAAKIVGLLGWWCGWAAWGEALTAQDLCKRYDLRSIPREPVVLDQHIKTYLGIQT
jgi:glutamyl-tRNA synthetase